MPNKLNTIILLAYHTHYFRLVFLELRTQECGQLAVYDKINNGDYLT